MADGSFLFVRTGALSIPAKFPVGNSGNIPDQMERLPPLRASFTISLLSWSKSPTKWMSVALRYFWTISTNFLQEQETAFSHWTCRFHFERYDKKWEEKYDFPWTTLTDWKWREKITGASHWPKLNCANFGNLCSNRLERKSWNT